MSELPMLVYAKDLPNLGIKFSRMHRHRLEKAGKFPRRILLGTRTAAYSKSELEAWLASRIAAREPATAPPVAA